MPAFPELARGLLITGAGRGGLFIIASSPHLSAYTPPRSLDGDDIVSMAIPKPMCLRAESIRSQHAGGQDCGVQSPSGNTGFLWRCDTWDYGEAIGKALVSPAHPTRK